MLLRLKYDHFTLKVDLGTMKKDLALYMRQFCVESCTSMEEGMNFQKDHFLEIH